MTKAIDETWTVGRADHQADWQKDVSAGLLSNGEQIASFGKLDFGCASDPHIDLEVTEQDDARARLASVAPEALRLLLAREWGRHNQCFECGGVSFVPAERSLCQGHKSSCAWVALMKRAGVR